MYPIFYEVGSRIVELDNNKNYSDKIIEGITGEKAVEPTNKVTEATKDAQTPEQKKYDDFFE